MKNIFFVATVLTGLVSQAANLNMDIRPSDPYVLPVSLPTCMEQAVGAYPASGVSANSIEYTRFNFSWTSNQTSFRFSALKVEMSDPNLMNGKYQCFIAGEELHAMIGADIEIAAGDSSMKSARCALRCGGLSFLPGTPSSLQVKGILTVYGLEEDTQGQSKPLIVEAPIGMTYQKF